jgi:alpha-L-arabinofuranosidase
LVNASSTAQPVAITLNGLGTGDHTAQLDTLKANTVWATNSIRDPRRIVPVKSMVSIKGERLEHIMPGYSIQVLEVALK